MNKNKNNHQNTNFLIDRLGQVFENLDRRNKNDIEVVKLDVSAIGKARSLVALRRSIERDADGEE